MSGKFSKKEELDGDDGVDLGDRNVAEDDALGLDLDESAGGRILGSDGEEVLAAMRTVSRGARAIEFLRSRALGPKDSYTAFLGTNFSSADVGVVQRAFLESIESVLGDIGASTQACFSLRSEVSTYFDVGEEEIRVEELDIIFSHVASRLFEFFLDFLADRPDEPDESEKIPLDVVSAVADFDSSLEIVDGFGDLEIARMLELDVGRDFRLVQDELMRSCDLCVDSSVDNCSHHDVPTKGRGPLAEKMEGLNWYEINGRPMDEALLSLTELFPEDKEIKALDSVKSVFDACEDYLRDKKSVLCKTRGEKREEKKRIKSMCANNRQAFPFFHHGVDLSGEFQDRILNMLVRCARVIKFRKPDDIKNFGIDPEEIDSNTAVRLHIMVSIASHIGFELIKRRDYRRETFGKKSPSYYREAHLLTQLAGVVNWTIHKKAIEEKNEEYLPDLNFPSPSLLLFSKGGSTEELKETKEEVCKYIDAMLNLLKSPGYILTADCVVRDLEGLVRKFDLGAKYDSVLEGLSWALALQFQLFTHLKPELTNSPNRTRHLVRIVDDVNKRVEELCEAKELPLKKTVMWSVGCGEALAERALMQMDKLEGVAGFDVTAGNKDYVEEGGKDKKQYFFRLSLVHREGRQERLMLSGYHKMRKWTRANFPETEGRPDMIFFGDVLHHLGEDRRYIYLIEAFNNLRMGGSLVIVEPVRSDLDEMTRESTEPYDSTSYSMLTAGSDLGTLFTYFRLRGAIVHEGLDPDVGPSIVWGRDSYFRVICEIRRGGDPLTGKDKDLDYEVKDPVGEIRRPDDIFEVFPFSLVDEGDRTRVKKLVQRYVMTYTKYYDQDRRKRKYWDCGYNYEDLRKVFISGAMTYLVRQSICSLKSELHKFNSQLRSICGKDAYCNVNGRQVPIPRALILKDVSKYPRIFKKVLESRVQFHDMDDNGPYREILDEMFKKLNYVDQKMVERNEKAGEAIGVMRILQRPVSVKHVKKPVYIDLSEQEGWKNVVIRQD